VARAVVTDLGVGEAGGLALVREALGLSLGPAVGSVAGRLWRDAALDGEKPARGPKNPSSLLQSRGEITPVVHCRQRPQNRNGAVGERELLGRAFEVVRARAAAERAEGASDAEHHGGGVDADDGRSSADRGPAAGRRPTLNVSAATRPPSPANVGWSAWWLGAISAPRRGVEAFMRSDLDS